MYLLKTYGFGTTKFQIDASKLEIINIYLLAWWRVWMKKNEIKTLQLTWLILGFYDFIITSF